MALYFAACCNHRTVRNKCSFYRFPKDKRKHALWAKMFRRDPGCGNLITFFQFLVVSLEGFIFTSKFGSNKRHVPLKNYGILVVLFFCVSVANNYSLRFNISMPLHMIFKSGSLVANMLLGILILRRKYSYSKYLSVIMVSFGITIATLASQRVQTNTDSVISQSKPVKEATESSFISTSFIGISLLTASLLVSAYLGIYQETLFAKYGKHPKEALFYSHVLPLPGFLLLSKDIYSHSIIFSESESRIVPFLGNVPVMWLYLLGNVLTQYVCVRSVFTLSTMCSSLTVTMVITLRKFISLIFSIVYFQNPFTAVHWFATSLVFGGTTLFMNVPHLIYEHMLKRKTTKVD